MRRNSPTNLIVRFVLALALLAPATAFAASDCEGSCCAAVQAVEAHSQHGGHGLARALHQGCCSGKKTSACGMKVGREEAPVPTLAAARAAKRAGTAGYVVLLVPDRTAPSPSRDAASQPEPLATPPPGPLYLRNLALLC